MTVQDALAGTDIAKTDAEMLLCTILQQNRAWLLAHATDELSAEQEAQWHAAANRRRKGEPVAYILGEREFYGRKFFVDRRVLIPRQCTESLIDGVKKVLLTRCDSLTKIDPDIVAWTKVLQKTMESKTIVDVGTGSGCLAITLALEVPDLQIFALDVSKAALDVARANAKQHGVEDRILFLESNLLDELPKDIAPFLIVSNPPYLSVTGDSVQQEVREWEPSVALFADNNGSRVIDQLVKQASDHPQCVGWVMECEDRQTKI